MTLTEIALKYHTDKVYRPDRQYCHDYLPVYEELLAGKKIRRVLEIGLGWEGLMHRQYVRGASLHMWAEAFPEALVYGLDIREDALVNQGRISSYLFDQGRAADHLEMAIHFERIGAAPFDLIVDDGSHKAEDQARSAYWFMRLLAPGGVYVIEDIYDAKYLKELLIPEIAVRATVIECHPERVENDRLMVIHG